MVTGEGLRVKGVYGIISASSSAYGVATPRSSVSSHLGFMPSLDASEY